MKNLKTLAAMVLMLLCSVTSYAYDFKVDGIYYYYNTDGNSVSVTSYGHNSYSGDVVIPATVTYAGKVYNVTSIGSSAFSSCSGLTSVTIPQGVTSIGTQAFSSCSGLTSVTIPQSVTSIALEAFYDCSALTSVTIPQGVTSIAEGAFSGCSGLTSVTIPQGVTSIGSEAFRGCSGLTSVTIPQGVTSIGNWAFASCSGLTSVTIPQGVTSIGNWAFANCSGLTSVTIPQGVTSIGEYAFNSCRGLTSVTIPQGVTSIGNNTFSGCSGLTSVTIPQGVTSIGSSAFSSCSGLTSVTIPQGVTSIGNSAFSYCRGLTSVTIPQGVTSIGSSAFSSCSALTSVTIPQSVTSIGEEAFFYCTKLTDVHISSIESWLTIEYGDAYSRPGLASYSVLNLYIDGEVVTAVEIPSTVTTIPNYAFRNCSALTSVTIPQGVTSIGNGAFQNCTGLPSVIIPNSVTSIGNNAFDGCSGLTSVSIPQGVTTIADNTFRYCSGLTSVTIPQSVTSIGEQAFVYCRKLTDVHISSIESWLTIEYADAYSRPNYQSEQGVNLYIDGEVVTAVEIPSTMTTIPDYAFSNCSGLTSVSIPQGVTTIGMNSFYGCSGLTSVTIPSSVTSIAGGAFSMCNNIRDVYISSIESWLTIEYDSWASHPNYVSDQDVNLYIDGEVVTAVDVPSTVTTIPDYAFTNLSALTSVSIPQGVTSIGSFAFEYCSSLTSVTIPQGVTSIGAQTFMGCSALTSVSIPQSVTSIGNSAFSGCSALTSVSIPQGVTTIGNSAFSGCSGLTSVSIPQGVTTIGEAAFRGANCEITVLSISPISLASTNVFSSKAWFIVPTANYDDYCTAQYWSDMKNRISRVDVAVQNLTLNAAENKSDLQVEIGEENLPLVTNLTISGTINSYDFMIMRNKMPMLRYLDLSQATIVHNDYEHYTGYHTEDNVFPAYGLYECNLFKLVLPSNIKGTFGSSGLAWNGNLKEIVIPQGITSIASRAFQSCGITSVTIPQGVTSIASTAFHSCGNLTSVTIPYGVTSIGSDAFQYCGNLTNIILPPTLKTIGARAFQGCGKLKEIRIPSSVREIGNSAFNSDGVTDVYVYTVEPFSIAQDAFPKEGNNFKGTLHAPKVSYWDYYYNTQWSQFLNFAEFDEPYENFYLEGDKVLDENTGSIEGEGDNNPDAEMGENSGIIVEDDVNQDFGDVDIEHDGENGGSIIVDGSGEVNADKLTFRINVQGGRWYFFCFPFDVRAEDIRCEGGAEWIFRYYDGNERAKNGKGGWKNVTSDGNGNFLKAATGYIFQCSKNDVLLLSAKNGKIKKEDKYNELVEHVTQNAQDASWNFVGNPYLSYYEITSNDYSAPITVWNGSNYIAIRPGDDDYQLAPFEAFFVQKPNGKDKVNYNSDNQKTYKQSKKAAADARLARSKQAINPNRLLVNITLSNGKQTDKTRVVFNNEADMKYEAECDAAKFSAADVPQLYTLDAKAVKYAINERPVAQGNVTLGYTAPVEGQYVLEAPRMDTPMLLMDNVTGTVHDFTDGAYEFTTEAGSYDARFTLIINGNATGINGVEGTESDGPIYNIKGQQVKDMKENGVYIKNNRKVISK